MSVLVERRLDGVSLIVEDDGRGFDARKLFISPSPNGGLGLVGMKERVLLAGGSIDIESAAQFGTTVYARIPLEDAPPPNSSASSSTLLYESHFNPCG